MKITILYGTTDEVCRIITPVLNEIVISLNILDAPVVVARWCGCHIESLQAMLVELEDTNVGHVIAITDNPKLTAEKMIEFSAQCDAIESFRHASTPFQPTNFGFPGNASITLH